MITYIKFVSMHKSYIQIYFFPFNIIGYIFVSQLWQPMPIMIWIAAAVEGGIENFIDMSILLFIQV